MKFHLNHIPAKPGFEIDHHDKIMLIGSCFSENIGNLLHEHKFSVTTNPSGILFNPLSIYQCLNDLIYQHAFNDTYVIQRGENSLSYLHHSSVNGADKNELIKEINSENKAAHLFLKEADQLIITFGTGYYYTHKQLNTVVANCHKQPGNLFEKKLASTQEIVEIYSRLIDQLQTINPKLKVIFTVSPVKHLKDGLVENNLSKSTLLLSVHALTEKFTNCFYFPAYELVNDDLRDYRFYKEDMAHPNHMAIEYVWQKFAGSFFSSKTTELNHMIAKLNLALNHRDIHGNSDEAAKLKEFIEKQKAGISVMNPALKF